ncbi:MAG: hypothetical protein ABSE89_11490 [Sedimentisphaerales bacterium]
MNSFIKCTTEPILALHISFVPQIQNGDDILVEFNDPYKRFAVLETILFENLPSPELEMEDEFYFIFIPSGSATSGEVQRKAERFIGTSVIETFMQSDRVIWRIGWGIVQGSVDRLEETLMALANFAFYEGELRKLEREIKLNWNIAEQDIHLTNSITKKNLKYQQHIDSMTRLMNTQRIRFARLEPRLQKSPLYLSGLARRLVSELCVQADIIDRLEAVSDRLEVFENLYGIANDRISEFRHFHTECMLKFWIIIILFVEVVIMALELYPLV